MWLSLYDRDIGFVSMQVLKAEHNSQRGSVFALLCGVVAIFAIVNIDKVVAVILTIVHDSWPSEGKVVGRVCVLSCSNCLHGMSAMHSACSLLHYSLPHLIFQTEFLGRFGQAYELSKLGWSLAMSREGRTLGMRKSIQQKWEEHHS